MIDENFVIIFMLIYPIVTMIIDYMLFGRNNKE